MRHIKITSLFLLLTQQKRTLLRSILWLKLGLSLVIRSRTLTKHIHSDKIKPPCFALRLYFPGDLRRYILQKLPVCCGVRNSCDSLPDNLGMKSIKL